MLTRLRAALGDRYTVEREVGRGGMATVYLAHDIRHQRRVAIKVLFPEFAASIGADRFAREIGIAAVLMHPHIVPLYDSGDADGLPFYVMPFIDGESLATRLEREHRLSLEDALRIAREVADALEYAHGHGIVHRDIKPDNIMLSGGHAMVADFGIARAIDVAVAARVTTAGVSIGTPHYMSPEQVFAEDVIDGRTDVYALGCVTFEMLAGRPPFDGATAREIALRHARDPVPALAESRADAPDDVQVAVERALAKEPADRWPTAAAFSAALTGLASSVPTTRGPPRSRRMSTRTRVFSAIALGLVGLAVIAGVVVVRSRSSREVATDPALVAVLPFSVVGDTTFQYLREGMVDLLSTKFSAMEGLHTVDTRTVLSVWHRTVRAGAEPSPEDARALAGALGSGRFILGEIVATPKGLAFTARLLDSDGSSRATAHAQGPADSLFALVDQLALELLAGSAGEPGRRMTELSSTSLPAVRAYLVGRAALRRGERTRAIGAFSDALEIDSTFALAALGMASSGAWSQQAGQSQALRRGLRTGYALRNRLSRRDQLLFEAWVLPAEPSGHTAARQLASWQRAADAAPDNAEAQYEYGDRLYHTGAQLGVNDAMERATATFSRVLALDSALGQATGHLAELAAHRGDQPRTRQFLRLYTRDAAAADAGDYVQWRAAVALDDRAALARLRSRRTDIAQSALLRIIGFGQAESVGLDDVHLFALELRRRASGASRLGSPFHSAQTLHSWAMNRGRSADQRDAIAMVRSAEPIAPGFSIVYFDADQIPVLDALFWDGDSTLARQALTRLAARTTAPVPMGAARAQHFTDLCVALLWAHLREGGHAPASRLAALRSGAVPDDSSGASGGNPTLCVAMLDAIAAVQARNARAGAAVAALDTLMAAAPFQFGVDFGNLVLARLFERQGDIVAALRVVRRRPYDWDTSPLYLSTFLRDEGRLAALAGDRIAAARAYRQYVALRAEADPPSKALDDSVRTALKLIEGR